MKKSIKKCVVAGATMAIMASMAISAYAMTSRIQVINGGFFSKKRANYTLNANGDGSSIEPGSFRFSISRNGYYKQMTDWIDMGEGEFSSNGFLYAPDNSVYHFHGEARSTHYQTFYDDVDQ